MRTTPTPSASLVPALPDALAQRKSALPYCMAAGFEPGDLLHLRADIAGHLAGSVLPVLGQCRCCDEQGVTWRLLAYVPASATKHVTYFTRMAQRFREEGQQERWFEGVQMRFVELDITDSADELALERPTVEAEVEQPAPVAHQPATRLRLAA